MDGTIRDGVCVFEVAVPPPGTCYAPGERIGIDPEQAGKWEFQGFGKICRGYFLQFEPQAPAPAAVATESVPPSGPAAVVAEATASSAGDAVSAGGKSGK